MPHFLENRRFRRPLARTDEPSGSTRSKPSKSTYGRSRLLAPL